MVEVVTTYSTAILLSMLFFFWGNHLSFWKSNPGVLCCTKKEPNQLLPLLFKVAVSSCNPSGDCRQRHWPWDMNRAAGRDRPCTAIPMDPTPPRHSSRIKIRLQLWDFPWKQRAVQTHTERLHFKLFGAPSLAIRPPSAADNLINVFK